MEGDNMNFPSTEHLPQTPLLVVDRAALERNLARMQALCDAAGVRLRAHGKTHKCSTLGRLIIERGAVGLCCQTVGEAEAYVAGGIQDVLVTAPSPPWGAARLAALAKTGARIGAVADDEGQIDRLSDAAVAAGVTLDLVVDLDLGTHRAGAYPKDALRLARAADAAPGLRFAGLQAYLGHLQHMDDLDLRKSADEAAFATLKALVAELTEAGLPPPVVTGGGTGTHIYDLASGVYTELQAGSYAVMDVEYDACGAPGGQAWGFEPAMAIAATVVSANHKSHVTVDAGFKAVSMDGPPARVVAGAAPGSLWRAMGDEHGMIAHLSLIDVLKAGGRDPLGFDKAVAEADADPARAWPADAPRVGDIVWLQPGHCDPTINLYDALHVWDGETLERWAVDGRRVSK
ncbi:alanine racemase [Caulobacter vibrioides]|nr:alanine racemase [Caulobacter vibrioides]YP_002518577.1 alanine racemase [Caulobacter vibrioides NA1000]ACL96669.1 alanine racemase [Caulobacter vibrioides NA1000]ATC29934.1 alanine racemase [Caulobacter vibrioides]QXZ51454.1 alanine racemase [Caulobacter vibrioides]